MTKQARGKDMAVKVRHPHGGHPSKEQKEEYEAAAIEATDFETIDESLKYPSTVTPPLSKRDTPEEKL